MNHLESTFVVVINSGKKLIKYSYNFIQKTFIIIFLHTKAAAKAVSFTFGFIHLWMWKTHKSGTDGKERKTEKNERKHT